MKAVVMEIHKDYCIVMTGDGRFIRQAVPAGELEIGDEIIVEEETFTAPGRDWIKTFAIAAVALLVIGFGSYGVFRIFGGSGRGSGEAAMVADAEMRTEEKANDETFAATEEEAVQEAPEEEETEMAAVAEEGEDFAADVAEVDGIPAGSGEVDVEFDLQISSIGEPVEIIAGNLIFLYWAAKSDEDMELLLIVEMLDPELNFTGTIEASILFDDGEPAGSGVIKFINFSRGQKLQNFIEFLPDAYTLHIRITGVFE